MEREGRGGKACKLGGSGALKLRAGRWKTVAEANSTDKHIYCVYGEEYIMRFIQMQESLCAEMLMKIQQKTNNCCITSAFHTQSPPCMMLFEWYSHFRTVPETSAALLPRLQATGAHLRYHFP